MRSPAEGAERPSVNVLHFSYSTPSSKMIPYSTQADEKRAANLVLASGGDSGRADDAERLHGERVSISS